MLISWDRHSLAIKDRPLIMGILNVTPDSFSDGGLYLDKGRAVERALEMEAQGADIIDIGGLSTRPGSEEIPVKEELRRTVPVIEALAGKLRAPISIDTYRSEVARAALEAGASMVNDISGLRFDPEMAKTVASYKVPVVVMHIKGTPKDMQKNPVYENLMGEIINYLKDSIRIAKEAGIVEELIIIDPGIGFGKTFDHNLEIIKNLHLLKSLGRPVLIGPSRKAFIGKILGDVPPKERLEGTMAAVSVAVFNGADIIRVHDVAEAVKTAKVAYAIRQGRICAV